MKVFAITLCLFVLMLGAVAWNALYINRMAFALCAALDALPDAGEAGCAEGAHALFSKWEKKSKWISATVSYPIVDRITEQITLLSVYAELGATREYRSTKALLYDSIEDMRRLETFTITGS